MTEILQKALPYDLPGSRLPGIAPLQAEDWLQWDDAFAGQMQRRDELLATRRDDVLRLDDMARSAAVELLERVLGVLRGRPGYRVEDAAVQRPDGVLVPINREDPLATLGRLVQEDFCLLQKPPGECQHNLGGAVLCFPAGWSLKEKFLRPLTRIHGPVEAYDENLARRVQRMFDAIRPEQPLWRANALSYDDPELFAPRHESEPRLAPSGPAPFIRSERQCLVRLAQTGAVVFSIHTYVVRRSVLNGG